MDTVSHPIFLVNRTVQTKQTQEYQNVMQDFGKCAYGPLKSKTINDQRSYYLLQGVFFIGQVKEKDGNRILLQRNKSGKHVFRSAWTNSSNIEQRGANDLRKKQTNKVILVENTPIGVRNHLAKKTKILLLKQNSTEQSLMLDIMNLTTNIRGIRREQTS